MTPISNSLTCWPKRASRVVSGIVFVCSTLWTFRCSLASISVIVFLIRSGSRVPCQREGKKPLPVKVHRLQKPKPMNSAMAKSRPMNLVLQNPMSARKNPPQDFSNPVNLGNVENIMVPLASGNWCRTQAKIQSNILKWGDKKTQKADSRTREDRDESSGSTSTRKLVRAVNTKEFHDMRI